MTNWRLLDFKLTAMIPLGLAFVSLLRAIQAVRSWALLDELLTIWPGYFLLNGLFWAVIGTWIAWSLWTRRRNALLMLLIAAGAYSLNLWLELIWKAAFQRVDTVPGNWPFIAVVNLALLTLFGWDFYSERKKQLKSPAQISPEANHERQPEN